MMKSIMEFFKGYLTLLNRVTAGIAVLYLLFPNLFDGIEDTTLLLTCTYIIFVVIVLMNGKYIKELKLRISYDNNAINKINRVYICFSTIVILTTLVLTMLDCYILRHIIWVVLDVLTK